MKGISCLKLIETGYEWCIGDIRWRNMHPIKLADRLEGKVWLIKRELSRILSGQVSTLRKIGANTFSTMDST